MMVRWISGAICATQFMRMCGRNGFDSELNSFVQYYGAKQLDASLLMLPLVGFLPATDPRMRGTVQAIQDQLMRDGFVEGASARLSA
jgi:glucoamylase